MVGEKDSDANSLIAEIIYLIENPPPKFQFNNNKLEPPPNPIQIFNIPVLPPQETISVDSGITNKTVENILTSTSPDVRITENGAILQVKPLPVQLVPIATNPVQAAPTLTKFVPTSPTTTIKVSPGTTKAAATQSLLKNRK